MFQAQFKSISEWFADLFGRRKPKPDPKPDPKPEPPPVWIEAKTLRIYYGKDQAQQYIDLYIPAHWSNERVAVVFLFHGGGWRRGDADADAVIAAKVPWLNGLGYAAASIEYRLGVDDTPPVPVWTQAEDIASAIGWVAANADAYGLDRERMGGIGHSAGAHLGSLAVTHPDLVALGGKWLKWYVALDSAAWNVVDLFNRKVPPDPLYIAAFDNTNDPPYCGKTYWIECSPVLQITGQTIPMCVVYSMKRGPGDRRQAQSAYAEIKSFEPSGAPTPSELYPVDLEHGELNKYLGKPASVPPELAQTVADYTAFVEQFLVKAMPKAA